VTTSKSVSPNSVSPDSFNGLRNTWTNISLKGIEQYRVPHSETVRCQDVPQVLLKQKVSIAGLTHQSQTIANDMRQDHVISCQKPVQDLVASSQCNLTYRGDRYSSVTESPMGPSQSDCLLFNSLLPMCAIALVPSKNLRPINSQMFSR
jgi:hypothetical protein